MMAISGREIEDIIDDILFLYNVIVSYKDVERIIKKIQRLDPPGIAARDLQETLIIQLKDSIEKRRKSFQSQGTRNEYSLQSL